MRETKQMNTILSILEYDKTHPTIQEIYQKVQKIDPTIGQATVYRNVNKLVKLGKLTRIPAVDDTYHYDGNCMPHDHLFCEKCHKIYDLFENDYAEITKKVESKYSIKINKISILYEGICEECNGKI